MYEIGAGINGLAEDKVVGSELAEILALGVAVSFFPPKATTATIITTTATTIPISVFFIPLESPV